MASRPTNTQSPPDEFTPPPFELGFPNERAKNAYELDRYRCELRPGIWGAVWPAHGKNGWYEVNVYRSYSSSSQYRLVPKQGPVEVEGLLGAQIALFEILHRYDKFTRGSNDDGAIQYEEF
jgi:hypothetical protein